MSRNPPRPEADIPRASRDLSPHVERARALVAEMSLEEKLRLMHSRQAAIPRLGIPEFHIGGEAAHGLVAQEGFATVFPQTIGLSSTWDRDLLYRVGLAVGEESRVFFEKRGGIKGLVPFAPTIDMERDPRWGRTEEAYGEDPVLAGRLSASYIQGLMGPDPSRPLTIPVCKHFYGI